jgi:hypothetical protein
MTRDVIAFRGPDEDAWVAAPRGAVGPSGAPGGHDRTQALLDLLHDDADLAAARHELLDRMRRTLPYAGQAEDLYLHVMQDFYPRVLEAHLAASLVAYLGTPDPSEEDGR